MNFLGQHILSAFQFSQEDIIRVMNTAQEFLPCARKEKVLDILAGKLLATLFYEPSTRTRLSFETAMHRLGGRVMSVVGMDDSSLKKGESLQDTAKVISQFVDVIAMRHPEVGSVAQFSSTSEIPVINGGDGAGEHPTQALLDIFTLWQERPGLQNLRIALVGDLKYGRTVHSLCFLLRHFQVEIVLVSPVVLSMPQEIIDMLKQSGITVTSKNKLEDVLGQVDVVYMTRVQKERFHDQTEYERLKHAFVLNRSMLDSIQMEVFVLHPLPRVGELHEDVDTYSGARYFKQVQSGVAVRMALLAMVLGKA